MSLVSSADLIGPVDLNGVEAALRSAVTAENAQASGSPGANPDNVADRADPASVEAQLPVKFRGKSAAEIAQSYLDLERKYGQVANDLGVQRKLTDKLLNLDQQDRARQAQADTATRNSVTELSSTELLTDPAGAIRKVLREEAQQLTAPTAAKLQELEQQLASERFLKKHQNCREISASQEFKDWLASSPVRSLTADKAATGDIQAADALFTDYENHLAAQNAATVNTRRVDEEAVRAARQVGLETGSGDASAGGNSGPKFRSVDLIELRIKKPALYYDPAFQDQIMKAYAEGRVS